MKKIIIFVSLIVVVLVIGTAAAFAGDGFHGRNFTDANGDGVCDNYVTGQCGAGFADTDGDGVCDNCGAEQCGAGFTDADGDGVCDKCGTVQCQTGYVDQNGDGLCDNRESCGTHSYHRGDGHSQGAGYRHCNR